MARILITSGPTREYLDPVRYLTNGSSGRMGAALALAAIELGHEVVIISGPVSVEYPEEATVVPVLTTGEMLEAAQEWFPRCDGLIGAAAPCDFRPEAVSEQKLKKIGRDLTLKFVETPDILAILGEMKTKQWMIAFALETEAGHARALEKLRRKRCDLIVLNSPAAIDAEVTKLEVLGSSGGVLEEVAGTKAEAARRILHHAMRIA